MSMKRKCRGVLRCLLIFLISGIFFSTKPSTMNPFLQPRGLASEPSQTRPGSLHQGSNCFLAVVGIFSTQADADREEHFRSWLRMNETCGLKFLFVRGHGEVSSPQDTIHLEVDENMNEGKSLAWFSWASTKFSYAEYIFKMDLDTAICPSKLLRLLQENNGQEYLGFPWKQKPGMLSDETCTFCPRRPWFYMSGGFYGMRMDLARDVSRQALISGHEDAVMGTLVNRERVSASMYAISCLHDCRFSTDSTCTSPGCPVLHLMSNKYRASQRNIC